jgi:hypothetical protein
MLDAVRYVRTCYIDVILSNNLLIATHFISRYARDAWRDQDVVLETIRIGVHYVHPFSLRKYGIILNETSLYLQTAQV